MTTIRLDDDLNNKLTTLIDIEKATKTDIIKKAISEYYTNHISNKTPFELGQDLFGKYGSDENLSSTYKSRLKRKLHDKHSH